MLWTTSGNRSQYWRAGKQLQYFYLLLNEPEIRTVTTIECRTAAQWTCQTVQRATNVRTHALCDRTSKWLERVCISLVQVYRTAKLTTYSLSMTHALPESFVIRCPMAPDICKSDWCSLVYRLYLVQQATLLKKIPKRTSKLRTRKTKWNTIGRSE